MARQFNYVLVLEGDPIPQGFIDYDVAMGAAEKAEDRGEFAHIYCLGDPTYSTCDEEDRLDMARRKTFLDIQLGLEEPQHLNAREVFESIAMALAFVGVIYLIALAFCAAGG